MNWEVKVNGITSRPLVIDGSPEKSDSIQPCKETVDNEHNNSGNWTAKSEEKVETAKDLDSSNPENNEESSKTNFTEDDSEKMFAEDISECVNSCLSQVICNVEADKIATNDNKAEYRTIHNISEDSEEDSDSWEDEDSDSSSSTSSDSSSSASSSSLASGEDSDVDIFSNKETNDHGPPRTKGELTLDDLPPIENLHITVPSNECMEIGKITSIVEQLVVIQAYKDTPALDLESVLFLKEGKQMLGHVFDVFGPVKEPCYCVRFNSPQHVNEHGVHVGMKVYCAPNIQEHSHFVFLSELLRQKGCDASWEHNNEPPSNVIEYSDDEEERRARKNSKLKKQGKSDAEDEQNKKHQTYEQQMNARNLRMTEKHRNNPGRREQQNTGAVARAASASSLWEMPVHVHRNMGFNAEVGSTFRPWGQGPGQIRQHNGPWRNFHRRNSPSRGSMQSRPSRFVRPPAFNMSMQYSQVPPVSYPTPFIQNRQPFFDASIPPPPPPAAPSTQPPGVNSGIKSFPEPILLDQQFNLVRSGSVPQNLSSFGNTSQANNTPPFFRSESMPSLQPPNYLGRPDTTRPPPTVSSNMMSHQFGSITFGNPIAFCNVPPHPSRPAYPDLASWLMPPPPPPQSSQSSPEQTHQNQSRYS